MVRLGQLVRLASDPPERAALWLLPAAILWSMVVPGTYVLAQSVIVSPAPDTVAVSIYRAPSRGDDEAMDLDWLEGYALITEKRTVSIPAGPARIRFEGVAGGMLPESAMITGLPAGVREKNLDADLLSPASLYARSFGRPVILRREHPKTGKTTEERAIIRSGPEGAVIVQTQDGFEAADCGPLNDSLVYAGVPESLSVRPTLSVETESVAPATATLSLSYLAWGFDWQTNYVVRMREGGKRADLSAWVTLASSDPTSFAQADAAVVGGVVNREDERTDEGEEEDGELVFHCFFKPIADYGLPPPPPLAEADGGSEGEIIVTASRRTESMMDVPVMVTTEGLGDLKLYRVPIPTTVAANAQKQVAMFDKRDVRVSIIYSSNIYGEGTSDVAQILRAQNKEEDGLGIPMPAGAVAVFEPLRGEQMLIGEGGIADKAVGQEVEILLGDATQVDVESHDISAPDASNKGKRWQDLELTVTNANPWPIAFEGDFVIDDDEKIERTSFRLARKNGRPLWKARVPANGSAKLRYRLRRTESD